jgi:hypothetical protein
MITQKQKVIIVFVILILLLSAIFFFISFDKVKLAILTTVSNKNTEKVLSDRKKCEDNFVLDEGMITLARKNDILKFLKDYSLCEFGVKADFNYCNSGALAQEKFDSSTCREIVVIKKVFLPLAQKSSFPQDVISDFKIFQSKNPPESPLQKLVEGGKNTSGDLLNFFARKDGTVCESLDRKGSCLGFFTGDVKYCQDILFDEDKRSCINKALLRQALESQSMEKCSEISNEDGLLPAVCESIVNKDPQLCDNNKNLLSDFSREYCKIENPLPI